MAKFADYTEFIEPLRLPYRGKTYEIQPVGIQDTVRLHLALEAAEAENAGEEFDPEHTLGNEEFDRLLLGPAAEEMQADNVPPDFVRRAIRTAVADFRNGREFAEMVWATDGSPKAMTQWIQERTDPLQSNGTGEASETPTPASTSGTRTSHPKPPRSPKATSSASRAGASSSRSGASSKRTSRTSTASTSTPKVPSGE